MVGRCSRGLDIVLLVYRELHSRSVLLFGFRPQYDGGRMHKRNSDPLVWAWGMSFDISAPVWTVSASFRFVVRGAAVRRLQ